MAKNAKLVSADVDEQHGFGHPLPIKLSRIERYPEQPRRYFDQQALEDLADSIQAQGLQTPVRVCKHSIRDGVFILIGGERRWRAFHIIQQRTGREPLVNALVDTMRDEKQHFESALLDNLQREDLVPLDEAAGYKRLYDDSDVGMTHSVKIATIAQKVKKSPSHVGNYLLMDSLPFPVKKLMDPALPKERRLAITAAIEIAKSTKHAELQLTIAKEAVERELGIDETRMLISMRTGRSGLSLAGSTRRPSDDFRIWRTFLNNTTRKLRIYQKSSEDFDDLYATREDEDEDRKYDLAVLESIIKGFEKLRDKIKADPFA